jgi:hypothetical protein
MPHDIIDVVRTRTGDLEKYVIRTSDRQTFKRCRQRWDYGSKLRQNYEPVRVAAPLDFGTAIHKALDVYYDPKTWTWLQDDRRGIVEAAASMAFLETNREQLIRYESLRGTDEAMRLEFDERVKLGMGMLHNYYGWASMRDNFTPVYSEIEFEVPIPVPPGMETTYHPEFSFDSKERQLQFRGAPVVYQGRIDLIVEKDGRYYIVDHKTCAQMREDVITFLAMDEQMKSYGWGVQEQLGIPIAGIVYNELYKGVPEPPAQNKTQRQGRWFSVNKQQDTSYTLYLETVKELDPIAHQAGLYDDILAYLQYEGKQYQRRTWVTYNKYEYQSIGYQICLEAIDMLSDPLIYPNPTRFQCGYCDFKEPCLSRMDGSDEKYVLDRLYIKRDVLPVPSTTDTTGAIEP